MLDVKKDCGGLTLPGCQLPTEIPYDSLPQQDRRGENKMWMEQDTGNLTRQIKGRMWKKRNTEILFSYSCQQECPGTSQEAGLPHR